MIFKRFVFSVDRNSVWFCILLGLWSISCSHAEMKTAISATDSTLSERMNNLRQALFLQGFGSLEWKVSQMVRGSLYVPFESKEETMRVVLVSIGDIPGADINVEVWTSDGSLIVSDTTRNLRAAVEWIAKPSTLYWIRFDSSVLGVEMAAQMFAASLETKSARLHGLFDADPLARRSVDSASLSLGNMGFRVLQIDEGLPVSPGKRLIFSVDASPGYCHMFVALGSPGVDSVQLSLMDGQRLVVADTTRRPEAWIRHCSQSSRVLKLIISVPAGSGGVSLIKSRAKLEDVEELVGPPLFAKMANPTFEQKIDARKEALQEAGYLETESLFLGSMVAGERVSAELPVSKGACVVVFALAEATLRDLDLEAYDFKDRLVAAHRGLGAYSSVQFCILEDAPYQIDMVAISGKGKAGLFWAEFPPSKLPPLPSRGTIFAAREAETRFGRVGLTPGKRCQLLERTGDINYARSLTLEGPNCFGLAIVAGSNLLGSRVVDSDNAVVVRASERDNGLALMAFCTESRAAFRVETEVLESSPESGPYLIIFTPPGSNQHL